MADDNLKIEPKKLSDKEKQAEKDGVPKYLTTLNLTTVQQDRLYAEIKKEIDAIKDQRMTVKMCGTTRNIDSYFDKMDRLYYSTAEDLTSNQFNISTGSVMVKCETVRRNIHKAFTESDPYFHIEPRPEYERKGGRVNCEKITSFLDYKFDVELDFKRPFNLVTHNAVLKGLGILKVPFVVTRVKKKREETYVGDLSPIMGPQGKPIIGNDGKPLMRNKALIDFQQNHPDAVEKYASYMVKIGQLKQDEEYTIIARFTETTYSDPKPKSVDPKNFLVRTEVDGYEGLKDTKFIGERMSFTGWELNKKEKMEGWYNIDKLKVDKNSKITEDFDITDFDITECVHHFKLNENDAEATKIICWISEEKEIVVGSINYPYYEVESYYIPFYVMHTEEGFYQPSLAETIEDLSIAKNSILNMTLEGMWQTNQVTPITENTDVVSQFLQDRFAHGLPIKGKASDIEFLENKMGHVDLAGLLTVINSIERMEDDKTGVSSYKSGRESPLDPDAPASKTIALLRESGIHIEAYIKEMLPSFKEVAEVMLQLYYQFSKGGSKYLISRRSKQVTGDSPFETLSRDEMGARVNIEARALSFSFDELNAKKESLALLQVLMSQPLFTRNPAAIHTVLLTVIKSWGRRWKNIANTLLPSLEELTKIEQNRALEAVARYVKAQDEQAKVTGIPPEYNPEALKNLIGLMVKEATAPLTDQEVEALEKVA